MLNVLVITVNLSPKEFAKLNLKIIQQDYCQGFESPLVENYKCANGRI